MNQWPQEAARIRAEALALEEEQKQQRREQRALAVNFWRKCSLW